MSTTCKPYGYIPVTRSRDNRGPLFMGTNLRWYHIAASSDDVKIYRKLGSLRAMMRRQGIQLYGWIVVHVGDTVDRTGTVTRPTGCSTSPASVL